MNEGEIKLTDYVLAHQPGEAGPELGLVMRRPPFERPDRINLTREGPDLVLNQGATTIRLKAVKETVLESFERNLPFRLVDVETDQTWLIRNG